MPETLFLELDTSNFGYSHGFLSQEKWWGQILAKLTFEIPNRHIFELIQSSKSLGLGTVPTTPIDFTYSQVSIKQAARLTTYICQVSKCLSPDKMRVFFDPNMTHNYLALSVPDKACVCICLSSICFSTKRSSHYMNPSTNKHVCTGMR